MVKKLVKLAHGARVDKKDHSGPIVPFLKIKYALPASRGIPGWPGLPSTPQLSYPPVYV